ncbi:MAG: DUF1492 domain-containing protein [Oscillospiraceae bacterium]|nr:DUF1492 domain-containing protein [Oscillospiraceae bacterium]
MRTEKIRRKTKPEVKKTKIEVIFAKTEKLTMQMKAKSDEIEYWRSFASVTSTDPGRTGGGKSRRPGSKIEVCVAKIMAFEESIERDMEEIIELQEQAKEMIKALNSPKLESLLTHRYICGKKWEDVAAILGYSYVHTQRLNAQALEELRKIEENLP